MIGRTTAGPGVDRAQWRALGPPCTKNRASPMTGGWSTSPAVAPTRAGPKRHPRASPAVSLATGCESLHNLIGSRYPIYDRQDIVTSARSQHGHAPVRPDPWGREEGGESHAQTLSTDRLNAARSRHPNPDHDGQLLGRRPRVGGPPAGHGPGGAAGAPADRRPPQGGHDPARRAGPD